MLIQVHANGQFVRQDQWPDHMTPKEFRLTYNELLAWIRKMGLTKPVLHTEKSPDFLWAHEPPKETPNAEPDQT